MMVILLAELFSTETAKKYVDLYGWFYMSQTVHKIAIHGMNIVSNSAIPIGMMSEEAQEASNKLIRRFREHCSQKMNRNVTMEDVFHRFLANSDPLIASLREEKNNKKRLAISSDVRKTLLEQNIASVVNNSSAEDSENEEEDYEADEDVGRESAENEDYQSEDGEDHYSDGDEYNNNL